MTVVTREGCPAPIVAGRGLCALWVDERGLLASRGTDVFHTADGGMNWTRAMWLCPSAPVRLLEKIVLWRRLLRSDIATAQKDSNGAFYCVGRKTVLGTPAGTGRIDTLCRVPKGTRPLSIALTDDGVLYWGEYFRNPRREEVRIFGSRDQGRSWYVAHVFPPGTVRHVHSVLYDKLRRRLWLLTGDLDQESRILWTDDHFATLHTAYQGSQRARAVTAVSIPQGLLLGTDAPEDRNFALLLRDDGRMETLAEIEGPCYHAARFGEFIFLSTAVEPSRVNISGRATVLSARLEDLFDWRLILARRKDRWPMRLFQYGNVALPDGPGDGKYAWASGVSLKDGHGIVWRWDLDKLRECFVREQVNPQGYSRTAVDGLEGIPGREAVAAGKGHRAEAAEFVRSVEKRFPTPIPFEELVEVTRATIRAAGMIRINN